MRSGVWQWFRLAKPIEYSKRKISHAEFQREYCDTCMADGIDPLKALVTTVTSHKENFQWTIIFLNFMQVKSLHWLWIRHGLQNHWAQPASLAWWNILRQCNLLLRLFVRRKTKVKSSWTWSLWLMSFWKWAFQSLWLILKDSGNGLQCWIRNFNHNISDHYNISRHGVRGGNRGEHIFDVIINDNDM